jgi:hypothetical protein
MTNPQYLGDGVYAQQDGCGIVLTTACHHDCADQIPEDIIFLEPEVLQALIKYIKLHYPKL